MKLRVFLLAGLLSSCDVFEYHPYQTDVNYHHLNQEAIHRILQETAPSDTLTVIAIGDTQRFYDETEAFVKSANQHPADFVLLNGDISDFGLKKEYEWVHDELKKLNVPYVAVIGNHDIRGNGEKAFVKMYGEIDDSFIVNGFKFIMLNTNSREYGFSGLVPDLDFLNHELSTADFEHAIVVSHIPPMDEDFDKELEEGYVTTLEKSGKVNLSLHAHRHSYYDGVPYEDEVPYLVTASMDVKMYVILRFFGGQFTVEKIYY